MAPGLCKTLNGRNTPFSSIPASRFSGRARNIRVCLRVSCASYQLFHRFFCEFTFSLGAVYSYTMRRLSSAAFSVCVSDPAVTLRAAANQRMTPLRLLPHPARTASHVVVFHSPSQLLCCSLLALQPSLNY
eukprot:gb/GECG01015009.1/.p1 GENE.gb/GECG01015009.1/~~gb/GECG01015009.1/.p1  ORF type:complete len:131 (+),score=5.65 gb/GECG01015009.1/:1-393(+)